MRSSPGLPLAFAALLLTAGCAYDGAIGYAPTGYPADYDSGMGSGLMSQPGDLFGGQNVASVAVFEAPLAPYGDWVNSRFGRAFRPDVPQDWRPYVNGQWGEDRLWVSSDPWGWATDHYGRWGFDERVGWVWVPGTEWAPSWVAFRDDPAQNVSGWAPIPPNVSYSLSYGFGTGFGYDSFNSWYAPSWVWVPRSYFYQPGFGGRVLPWRYGANYWGSSRWQNQPGWGGRPRFGNAPGYRDRGDWQGGDQYPGRQWQGQQYSGRPWQDGQYSGRPARGGPYSGFPQNGGPNPGQAQWGDDTGHRPADGALNGMAGVQNGQRRLDRRGVNPQFRGSPDGAGGGRTVAMPDSAGVQRNDVPRPVATLDAPPPPQRVERQREQQTERQERQMMRQEERPAPTSRVERDLENPNVRPD